MTRTTAHESMFGENFKYVLALTLLAWVTYTLPSVRQALADVSSYNPTTSIAAVTAAHIPGSPVFFTGINRDGSKPLPPEASSSMQRGKPMDTPGRGPEMPQKKELTPQQVVTLLFKLGFISQENLDKARVAVEHYPTGTSTPPLPCIATSTVSFHGTSTLPMPCKGIDNHPLRPGTTTPEMHMMQKLEGRI